MPAEVIFILILIIFSILESAFRGKRRSEVDLPTGGRPPPGWPGGDQGPTTGRVERGGEGVAVEGEPQRPRETADQMVPDDIWEEIAALARGDVEETLRRRRERRRAGAGAETRPEPGIPQGPPRRAGEPPRRARGPSRRPVPGPVEPADRPPPTPVRRPRDRPPVEARQPLPVPIPAEEERGEARRPLTDEVQPALRERMERAAQAEKTRRVEAEAERSARAHPGRRPPTPITEGQIVGPGRPSGADDDRIHRLFRGSHALRHAVIAREVLGRPLALRDYGDEELWSQ